MVRGIFCYRIPESETCNKRRWLSGAAFHHFIVCFSLCRLHIFGDITEHRLVQSLLVDQIFFTRHKARELTGFHHLSDAVLRKTLDKFRCFFDCKYSSYSFSSLNFIVVFVSLFFCKYMVPRTAWQSLRRHTSVNIDHKPSPPFISARDCGAFSALLVSVQSSLAPVRLVSVQKQYVPIMAYPFSAQVFPVCYPVGLSFLRSVC